MTILAQLRAGDIAGVGAATTRNFFGPLQTIIPWASNLYTETLIEQVRAAFGDDFWGFWMLGGMSGGGMGFIFAPARKAEAQARLQALMSARQAKLGARAALRDGAGGLRLRDQRARHLGRAAALPSRRLLPPGYYALMVPRLLRIEPRTLSATRRAELDRFAAACRTRPELAGMVQTLFDRLLPHPASAAVAMRRRHSLARTAGSERLRPHAARADPRRSAERADRPGAEPAAASAPRFDDVDARRCDRRDRRRYRAELYDAGHVARWPRARWRWCRWLGGRQPLDAGRRRGQGAASVRQAGRQASHLYRSASGQEPAHRPAVRHSAAAYPHHQLPDPRADRRLPGGRARHYGRPYGYAGPLLLSPGRASACAWCRWCAICALPGKRCRSRCWTSRPKRCARACTPR